MKRTVCMSAVLAFAALTSVMRAAPIHAATTPSAATAGSLPAAALHPAGAPTNGQYPLGLTPTPSLQPPPKQTISSASLPASVDLSQFDPPVGNQNGVNSCSAWALTNLLGWYARRDGYYPGSDAAGTGGFAPMYTYAQIVNGSNSPTTLGSNLNILQSQGVDTKSDYFQGNSNYKNLPTASETTNAVQYRISASYDYGNPGPLFGYLQPYVEADLATGTPVVIAIPVYQNLPGFRGSYYSGPSGNYLGNHAVMAVKYDSNGLWIENQWGTGWGVNGYTELSWSFVNTYGFEYVTVRPDPVMLRGQDLPGDYRYTYVLGSNGNLWREAGNANNRTQVDGNVAAFQPAVYPMVYVLSNDGTLWRENGNYTNRSAVDGSVHRFQALDATRVFVLGNDGNLWLENGDWTNRTLVDGNVSAFQALSTGIVFVKGTNGKLWLEEPNSSHRSLIDSNVEAFQAMNTSTIYVLGLNGNLWREYGNYTNRSQVDSNVEAFQATDSTNVYVEGTDGKLWNESGSYTNRTFVDGKVAEFQGLSTISVLVLGTDGTLWQEDPNQNNRYWVDATV
jgi:hypothetical protein